MTLEQANIVQQSARAFLARRSSSGALGRLDHESPSVDAQLWREIAQLGWLGAMVPQLLGGVGGSLQTVLPLCHELGRALCAVPFLPVAVAAVSALLTVPTDPARALLQHIARGSRRAVLAVSEDAGSWMSPTCGTQWDGRYVSGRKRFVEEAHLADSLIVSATDMQGRGVTVLVDPRGEGVRVAPVRSMSGLHWCDVELKSAEAQLLVASWTEVSDALVPVAVAHAAWCAGAAQRLLEDTVAYVSHRKQFGVAIGSFQSVQHRLADCDIAAAEAAALAEHAAQQVDLGASDARRLSSSAFVRSTDAFVTVARHCHQVWGGMGYSNEAQVHHFSRAAKVAQQQWGGVAHHLNVVAEELASMPLLRDRYRAALATRGIAL